MTAFQPADNLRSRTFLGLLAAQFLAAFNDQAIHASSMFFAINTNAMSKDAAISLMPILFYAPWALFCTLAGYLADRYSKWHSLVFWKFAEIAITLVALLGFWLGANGAAVGPYLVLSTVFLMGTHSAFFVPAKYGAMPEILTARMLSRGNGVLESLSFLAVILGTVMGGVLSKVFRGQEYYIGLILVALAVVGSLASLMMQRMPAANAERPFPKYVYGPLWQSIRGLLRSRPLAVAVVGIAFFTFIVAFMRSTMYMHGQTRVPPWDEATTSEVVGMVALGIGLGSPLVGFLSGGKVELGMVTIGALGMILATAVAATLLDFTGALVACITSIGFFTGFYIVPLFTLLQHRAPKTSKGDAIATSNFINVTGAIVSSVLFFLLVGAAHFSGITPTVEPASEIVGQLVEEPEYEEGKPIRLVLETDRGRQVIKARSKNGRTREIDVQPELIDVFGRGLTVGDRVADRRFRLKGVTYHRVRRADQEPKPFYDESGLPKFLFLGASSLTLLTLLILWRRMPDLFLRTAIWLRTQRRYRLEVEGMNHLPDAGPVVLITNACGVEARTHVLSAADRTVHFVQSTKDEDADRRRIADLLSRGNVVALSPNESEGIVRSIFELARQRDASILPVWHEVAPQSELSRRQRIYITGGRLLPPDCPASRALEELQRLAEDAQRQPIRRGVISDSSDPNDGKSSAE